MKFIRKTNYKIEIQIERRVCPFLPPKRQENLNKMPQSIK